MNTIKKYCIYGGSFDPIHIGHVTLADSAVRECGLDKLIFMPAYISPFKQDRQVTAGKDRCAMIQAVLNTNSAFCLSTYELKKVGPSYTIETLRHWKKMLDGEIYLLVGFDSAVQLKTWYEGEEILRDYHIITARRPHSEFVEGIKILNSYKKEYGTDITLMEMPPVDASSTEVRAAIKEGRSIAGMVLPGVEEYIIEHKLYR